MPRCGACGVMKPLDAFATKGAYTSQRKYYCRVCDNASRERKRKRAKKQRDRAALAQYIRDRARF